MLVFVASKALFISPLYLATAPSILSFSSSSGLVPLLLYISTHNVASICCLFYRFHKHYRVPVFVISPAVYYFKHWHLASSFHDAVSVQLSHHVCLHVFFRAVARDLLCVRQERKWADGLWRSLTRVNNEPPPPKHTNASFHPSNSLSFVRVT